MTQKLEINKINPKTIEQIDKLLNELIKEYEEKNISIEVIYHSKIVSPDLRSTLEKNRIVVYRNNDIVIEIEFFESDVPPSLIEELDKIFAKFEEKIVELIEKNVLETAKSILPFSNIAFDDYGEYIDIVNPETLDIITSIRFSKRIHNEGCGFSITSTEYLPLKTIIEETKKEVKKLANILKDIKEIIEKRYNGAIEKVVETIISDDIFVDNIVKVRRVGNSKVVSFPMDCEKVKRHVISEKYVVYECIE